MSRSRRKTPIMSVTTATSEKKDKRDYNRRYRRVAKQAIESGDENKPLPIVREHSDPWVKAYTFDPGAARSLEDRRPLRVGTEYADADADESSATAG